jgi:PAS domain S-box-containing protein
MGRIAKGRQERHRMWRLPAIVSIVFGVAAAGMLIYATAEFPSRQREASRLADHTLEVLGSASMLEAHLERFISDGRAYVISGFPDTQARANDAVQRIGEDLSALRAATADNAEQQATLDRLGKLIDARVAVLRDIMALVTVGDQDGLEARLKGRAGGPLTAEILAEIEHIKALERHLLVLRRDAADSATRQTIAALLLSSAVAAGGVLSSLAVLFGYLRERAHLRELSRAEALLRTIMQTVPGHIYAKDLQGRMLVANAAVLAFLGKPWTALEGRADREFLDDPAEAEAIMANDRRVIAEGKTQALEERVGTEGDAARIWLSTKTPMRDDDGVIIGMIGVSVDITERKRAEDRLQAFNAALEARVQERTAELADSRERQQAYFNHSPIGMVVMRVRGDGDFVLEDLNPAARAAFGFPAQSERGSTYTELWPEMVARDKQRKMHDCVTQRTIIEYTVEREIRGEKRLLEIMLVPLLDDTSEARFVLICVHDVTTQRRLERQVMEQAERQAEAAEREMALFNNSPDELFIVRVEDGPDGPAFVYEAFSPALMTVTGLRPQDLIGYRPEQCLPPTVAQSILANYRRCLRERSTVKFTETRDLEIGKRDVEGWVTPVLHPATGRVVRLVGDVRDVTERNRMEAAFRQGQKMEAIGLLAAGVAHDFNNILQAVISGLDMVIEETRPGTPAHDIAGVALGSAMRGSQLTHHLLSYARKQMLWPQTIDLAAFLPEIEHLMTRTLGPHIAIDLRVEPGTHACADPGELETALLNIAFNAAHAMAKGGTLSIDARSDDTDGTVWGIITVADTGNGMDTATLAQAVEPFFTTKGLKGTGLGLPMVQGFAEQSGGSFRIASAPGHGTTVELRLPAAATARFEAPEAPATATALISGRILLVDDSTDVLVTVGAGHDEAGLFQEGADGGDRALAHLAEGGPVDVLVSDYAMPGLNGAELIARARLLQPGLRALIITGYAAVGCAECDGTTILHKPFHRRALIEALCRVLARDPATAETMAADGPI